MKKLLLAALLTAGVASVNATVINWSDVTDAGPSAGTGDWVLADGVYTGTIGLVKYNNGSFSGVDALHNKFALIDLNANKFYLATNSNPAALDIVLSADFGFDVTEANFESIGQGYTLGGLVINNTIGSAALAEFALAAAIDPEAKYKFSLIDGLGNGQVATVPEPGTLGLMGLGMLTLAFAARRRKQA